MTEDSAEEHRTFASGSEALSAVVCSTMNSEDIEFSLNYQQAAFVHFLFSCPFAPHCHTL